MSVVYMRLCVCLWSDAWCSAIAGGRGMATTRSLISFFGSWRKSLQGPQDGMQGVKETGRRRRRRRRKKKRMYLTASERPRTRAVTEPCLTQSQQITEREREKREEEITLMLSAIETGRAERNRQGRKVQGGACSTKHRGRRRDAVYYQLNRQRRVREITPNLNRDIKSGGSKLSPPPPPRHPKSSVIPVMEWINSYRSRRRRTQSRSSGPPNITHSTAFNVYYCIRIVEKTLP